MPGASVYSATSTRGLIQAIAERTVVAFGGVSLTNLGSDGA
jgi:predicted flavoprotein YhiN